MKASPYGTLSRVNRALWRVPHVVACLMCMSPSAGHAQVRLRPDTVHAMGHQENRVLHLEVFWEDSTLAGFETVIVRFAPGFKVGAFGLDSLPCGTASSNLNTPLRRITYANPVPAPPIVPCVLGDLYVLVDLGVDSSFPITALGVLRSGDTIELNPPGSAWEGAGLNVLPSTVPQWQRISLVIALILGVTVTIWLLRRTPSMNRRADRHGSVAL